MLVFFVWQLVEVVTFILDDLLHDSMLSVENIAQFLARVSIPSLANFCKQLVEIEGPKLRHTAVNQSIKAQVIAVSVWRVGRLVHTLNRYTINVTLISYEGNFNFLLVEVA